MDINLARLNHILIPTTRTGRDRFRQSRAGRLLRPALWLYETLTAEGNAVLAFTVAAAVLGLDLERTSLYLLCGLLVGLLVAALVLAPLQRLRGGSLRVTAPARIAVGEVLSFALTLRNDSTRAWGCVRLMGPFLPWDGSWVGALPSLPSLAAGAERTVIIRGRFVARGEHHLDPFRAALLAPLGLTVGPNLSTDGCRLMVVPHIARLSRLALADGHRLQPGGVPLVSGLGESQELFGVRPYRPGDPVRDLHARSWARTGTPVVREYRQEHFRRVGVVLDLARPVEGERTFEAMVSLAAGVVAHLSRSEALVDLLLVGETVRAATVGRSLGSIDRALDLLACVEPAPSGATTDLAAALAPTLGLLSSTVVIAARWDEARRPVGELVRRAGGALRVGVVTRDPSLAPSGEGIRGSGDAARRRPELGVTFVDARAIAAGEPVGL